jgi:hypothetical protein
VSTVFLMSGSKAKAFHGTYSRTRLDIRGTHSLSGPQPIGEGGVPQWVADAFDAHPGLMQIALNGEDRGAVYSRLEEES